MRDAGPVPVPPTEKRLCRRGDGRLVDPIRQCLVFLLRLRALGLELLRARVVALLVERDLPPVSAVTTERPPR